MQIRIPSFTIILLILILSSSHILHASEAKSEYRINGVSNNKIAQNIKVHLQQVDVDVTREPSRLWKKPLIDLINKAIQPFGYYNAEIELYHENNIITAEVALNDPVRISHITLEVIGDGREDTWFANRFKQFPLKLGDPLLQHQYDKFKADMIATAISRGYFDFSWQAARLDIVREQHQANVLLIAQSGKRYRYGRLRIKGDELAKELVTRINTLTYGQFYQAEEVSEFNRRLSQTGYFNRAIARPIAREADDFHTPIEVTLSQKPRDLIDIGGGFSTDIGPRLDLKWQRPWVNNEGHSFSTDIFMSAPEQAISSRYNVPMGDVKEDYLSYQVSYEKKEEDDTRSQTYSLGIQRFWKPQDSDWQHTAFIRYRNETFTQGFLPRQTTQLILPGYTISGIRSRGGLDVEWGNRSILTIEAGTQGFASDIDIIRVVGKTKWIRSIGEHRITARAEFGVIETNNFSQVPASLRFFTGGDQSIRGFSYESIAPLDEQNELSGGRYLAVGSTEYAFPVANSWRIAAFVDVGTATNDFDEGLSVGTGFGVHYLSLIGPIRVYLAYGENDFDRGVRLHISLGPTL